MCLRPVTRTHSNPTRAKKLRDTLPSSSPVSTPETADYSAVTAISMMWLAARAEGIGMGWISILDSARVNDILDVPTSWRFIGYFCLGYPQVESDRPELERAGWEQRQNWKACVLRR